MYLSNFKIDKEVTKCQVITEETIEAMGNKDQDHEVQHQVMDKEDQPAVVVMGKEDQPAVVAMGKEGHRAVVVIVLEKDPSIAAAQVLPKEDQQPQKDQKQEKGKKERKINFRIDIQN